MMDPGRRGLVPVAVLQAARRPRHQSPYLEGDLSVGPDQEQTRVVRAARTDAQYGHNRGGGGGVRGACVPGFGDRNVTNFPTPGDRKPPCSGDREGSDEPAVEIR